MPPSVGRPRAQAKKRAVERRKGNVPQAYFLDACTRLTGSYTRKSRREKARRSPRGRKPVSCFLNGFTNTNDDCILEVECRFPLQPDLPSVTQSENSW